VAVATGKLRVLLMQPEPPPAEAYQ
jgi:hypothetical protein